MNTQAFTSPPAAPTSIYEPPSWLAPYRDGQRIGHAQGMPDSEYLCCDGSADSDPEIEERVCAQRTPMVPFASRTGTKRNLAAMRENGWGLLVSAKGVLRTEGFKNVMLDNGAWSSFQAGEDFDELAFGKAFDLLGEKVSMVVLPDIVCGGMRSLELTLKWMENFQLGYP